MDPLFTLHRLERRRIYISFAAEVAADTTLTEPAVRVLRHGSWTGANLSEHIVDGEPVVATAETVSEDEELPGILVWLQPGTAEQLPAGTYAIEARAEASSQEKPVFIGDPDTGEPPVFRLVG